MAILGTEDLLLEERGSRKGWCDQERFLEVVTSELGFAISVIVIILMGLIMRLSRRFTHLKFVGYLFSKIF